MKLPEDHDPHAGTSDATPGGLDGERRPGEAVFALALLAVSLFLLWHAYGISGFAALSSPGAVPMAVTGVMVVTAGLVLVRTLRRPLSRIETLARDIVPPVAVILALMLIAYGILLRPLGFLPTSALFLVAAIKILGGRSWFFALGVALVSLAGIWVVFRLVFTVLMPPGIVPEAQIVQFFRDLLAGAGL